MILYCKSDLQKQLKAKLNETNKPIGILKRNSNQFQTPINYDI